MRWQLVDFAAMVQFLGSGIALVFGAGILLAGARKSSNTMLAAVFFCFSLLQCYTGMETIGTFCEYPHLICTVTPIFMSLGPLLYLYSCLEMVPRFTLRPMHILNGVPLLLFYVLLIPYFIRSSEFKLNMYLHTGQTQEVRFMNVYFFIVHIIMFSYLFIYSILTIRRYAFVLDAASMKREPRIRIFIAYTIIIALILILITYAWVIEGTRYQGPLRNTAYCLITAALISIFMVWFKYPDIFAILRKESARVKYEKSRLRGLDADAIVQRLEELMTIEHRYADEDLDLDTLAAELSISKHQLSEILNNRLNTSFRQFVSAHRVRAAQAMLREEPERSIFSCAIAVGFNSKSSFNTQFKEITGFTPTEYRATLHPKK